MGKPPRRLSNRQVPYNAQELKEYFNIDTQNTTAGPKKQVHTTTAAGRIGDEPQVGEEKKVPKQKHKPPKRDDIAERIRQLEQNASGRY